MRPAGPGGPARGSLRETQVWMVGAITGAAPDAEAPEARLTAGPSLSAAARLGIYRDGYRARLVECLRDDYPILARTLGVGAFEALAAAYATRYPSASPNLNAFGARLPAFLVEAEPDALDAPADPTGDAEAPSRAFLVELARLEWAVVETVHAAPSPPLDPDVLAAVPADRWGDARFVPAETTRLLEFARPVNAYFQACLDGDDDAPLPPIPAPRAEAVVVYRLGTTIWRMSPTPAMTAILRPLLAGATIGEALAAVEADAPDPDALADVARNLTAWFAEWVRAGFFAGLVVA